MSKATTGDAAQCTGSVVERRMHLDFPMFPRRLEEERTAQLGILPEIRIHMHRPGGRAPASNPLRAQRYNGGDGEEEVMEGRVGRASGVSHGRGPIA